MTSHPNRSPFVRMLAKGPTAPALNPDADDWKQLRARHGLTQAGLAARLQAGGITARAIQKYEQGEREAHPAIWRYALAQMGELALPE